MCAATQHHALLPVVGAETRVPLLDGRWVPYANLDVAASTPPLKQVADRLAEVLPWYASVHRGAGYLSQVSTSLYEGSRETVGRFVGARDDDVTIITRNTTDAVNLLASVTPGRTLVLDVEHHATLLPWARAGGSTVLTGEPTVRATLDRLDRELAGGRYALLAVTGASNVTGESLPVDEVVALARRHGTRIFVDAAQLLAHRRLSLEASDIDYVAFSGHKVYAPFGAGALVGRRDWLDDGEPYLAGGGAVRSVEVETVTWAPSPARHEAGTPNLLGAIALAAACEALGALDDAELSRHASELRTRMSTGLAAIPGVSFARLWSDASEPIGVVTFTLADTDPGLLAAYLSAEHGLGVRDGRFCAHPLLARLGLDAGAVRASLGVGSTGDQIDRLIAGVQAFVSDRPYDRYEVRDGGWSPLDDQRELPAVPGLSALTATAVPCTPLAIG